jgi:hypothetical protein
VRLTATLAARTRQPAGPAAVRARASPYIANLDFLVRIEPTAAGDAQMLFNDGTRIPCNRRYRASLREDRFAAAAAE